MAGTVDLAVVTQDPWLGGGARAQLEAFLDAARAAGREPTAFYASREFAVTPRRPLGWRHLRPRVGGGRPYRGLLPELEPLNQAAALRMLPALRTARSLWVVSTTAHFGLPAALSGRAYGCWIGTSVQDEWDGRLAGGLSGARHLAGRAALPLLRRSEQAVLRGSRLVFATSPASRAQVAMAAELDRGDVRLVPLPVDTDVFAPEPDDAWTARLAAPTIGFVGRADDPRKNVPLLLDAFERLRAELPDARLRLIGRPPAAPVPGGVELVPSPPSVVEPLRTCSVFVLPSRQEGFGIVVAEALACGVPVVVTPSGGPLVLVLASEGGIVLDSWDTDELAGALRTLLTDRGRLLHHRRRGRAYVMREHAPGRVHRLLAAALDQLDAT